MDKIEKLKEIGFYKVSLKLISKFNYKFLAILLNVISIIGLIIQFYLKSTNTLLIIICISIILFSVIYFFAGIINILFQYVLRKIKHWNFKYETQNLNMLIFNNRWNLNPSYDCLLYISKNGNYSRDNLNDLLNKSNDFSDINTFELYQEFVRSLCTLSVSELKNMNSFLNIDFSKPLSNKLCISIFLFILTTVFGVDVHNDKIDFNGSYLYKILNLTDNFSVRAFVIYVFCVVIFFIIVIWIAKRKQKRTLLVMKAAIKQAMAQKDTISRR